MNGYFSDYASVFLGDCLERLREFPDCSVDSVVTDPPYEIGFMGRSWDSTGIAYQVDLWKQVLRVLKPGGHLLAFGATRSYHRMAVAIEDAGFEIRDSIHWTYGSGFPKSLDVGKAIDKQRYDRADVYRVTGWIRDARDAAGLTNKDINERFGVGDMARHWTDVPPTGKQPSVPTLDQVPRLLEVLGVEPGDVPGEIRRLLWDLNGHAGEPGENWFKREVTGVHATDMGGLAGERFGVAGSERRDAPATDAAKTWEGWGTALKPSHEPIVVARKPVVGTVAQNVLAYGTGGLNIDGTRVGTEVRTTAWSGTENYKVSIAREGTTTASGRWPANTVLSHSVGCRLSGETVCVPGCPVAALDAQSGTSKSTVRVAEDKDEPANTFALGRTGVTPRGHADTGGASRYFKQTVWEPEWDDPFVYCAKPSKRERNAGLTGLPKQQSTGGGGGIGNYLSDVNSASGKYGSEKAPSTNHHPTVKPVQLMRYLCKLVTPPGGTVLDPFTGSGTTGVAAILEGYKFLGIELTEEYLPIIQGRLQHAEQHKPEPTLFDGDAA